MTAEITDNSPVIIGSYPWNGWTIENNVVDLTRKSHAPTTVTMEAAPQRLAIDLARTAIIVIDMQNEFCSIGGWVDYMGADIGKSSSPIAPLQRLLPKLREHSIPVVWVNWGNRGDRANLPPGILHVVNPDGKGLGIGDVLPSTGSRILQRDNWSTSLADGLTVEDGDLWVHKYRISGFWDTELDSILRNLDVKTLLFSGVNLDQCVLACMIDAACIGYDVVLLSDCAATTSPDYCTEATIYNVKASLGFVTTSDSLIDALQ